MSLAYIVHHVIHPMPCTKFFPVPTKSKNTIFVPNAIPAPAKDVMLMHLSESALKACPDIPLLVLPAAHETRASVEPYSGQGRCLLAPF